MRRMTWLAAVVAPWVLSSCFVAPDACGVGCEGCCSPFGQCVTATTEQSCGRGGALCVACGAGQRCQAGVCGAPGVDGGTGGSGGAGGGSAGSGGSAGVGGSAGAGGAAGAAGGTAGSGGAAGSGGSAGSGGGGGGGVAGAGGTATGGAGGTGTGGAGASGCLTLSPDTQVTFAGSATTATVTLRNGATCGALRIDTVRVDTSPYFALVAPLVADGTVLQPGGVATATVAYRRPLTGGTQVGTLRVHSSDVSAADRQLVLLGDNAVDGAPVAVLTSCTPAQLVGDATCLHGTATSSRSVSLQTLTGMANGQRALTMSGINSSVPRVGGNVPASAYQFSLVLMPAGASTTLLTNHNVTTTSATQVLTIPGAGTYGVSLRAFNATNVSSATVLQVITVTP